MGYNDIYRIAALIVKSIKGKESEEERNELDVWRNASDRNRRLYQKYQDAEYFRARSIVKEKEYEGNNFKPKQKKSSQHFSMKEVEKSSSSKVKKSVVKNPQKKGFHIRENQQRGK